MTQIFPIATEANRDRGSVVFVHGLGGDPYGTWGGDGTPTSPRFWPRWLARDVPDVAVYSLGYPAAPTRYKGSALWLEEQAHTALKQLLTEPRLRKAPLAFVAHSLGGLVVKKAIQLAHDLKDASADWRHEDARQLLDQVTQVVFLATPHLGADLAAVADWFGVIARPSNLTKGLIYGAPGLIELNEWYREWATRVGIDHLVFAETEETKIALGLSAMIVPPISANPSVNTRPISVPAADHFSICKPTDTADSVYSSTKDFLQRLKNGRRLSGTVPTGAEVLLLQETALANYRAARIDEWSSDRYGAGDKLFTQLSLLLDRGQDADERWVKLKEKFESLAAILQAHRGYPALVLLGDPGAGKSTLLRRLDLDIARGDFGGGTDKQFSYFVSLRDYRGEPGRLPPGPMVWLRDKWAKEWKAKQPHLPDLEDLLRGESYLLLDALNEMPLRSDADYAMLVDSWTAFIADTKMQYPKCRIVFSCRSLDYSASLSNPDIQVPHVEIETLDRETIKKFLRQYARENAEALFQAIEASDQLDLYGNAYFLRMLCDHAGRTGQIPQDRAALFTAFVRELLRREINKKTRVLVKPGLLDAADLARLAFLFQTADPSWRSPYELPENGPLFPQLAAIAYAMQARAKTAGNSHVVVASKDVRSFLTPRPAPKQVKGIIEGACALTALELDIIRDTVQFIHQLMQEYFAARHLVGAPEPERVRTPWRKTETQPRLEDALATVNVNEPLPMLVTTGWEETTLLAAAMAPDRNVFLESLIDINLPLAGRAAAQIQASEAQRTGTPDVGDAPCLSPELITRIQNLLLDRMADPEADLRARITAGKALGEVGDPRFNGKKDAKGKYQYLVPPLIDMPGGRYQIGAEEPIHAHEGPRHTVDLADFAIAQFPLTNAEWDCFVRDGGYGDDGDCWWSTGAAKQWRKGDTTRAARDAQWYAFKEMLKRNPQYVSGKLETGEISPKAAEDHYKAMHLSDQEFAETLQKDFKGHVGTRYIEPRRWRNKDFNNPLQPVVGICWFEAQAYCAWLSAQTGQLWRLPTEAEWEAAARFGSAEDAEYPWGRESGRERCNTFESHIRAPTPVGIFPGGNTAAGLVDVSGNVYEWTSSKYSKEKYPYPYNEDDGRESPEDVEDPSNYEPRVLRGGAWYYSKDEARIAFRLRFHPGFHSQSTGLRLVLAA